MSVLDAMTAGIMQTKATKAAKLTPVAGESATPVLPNDVPGVFMSTEVMRETAADLRKQAAVLIAIADGLDVLTGEPAAVAADEAKTVQVTAKLKETARKRTEADEASVPGVETFSTRFAKQQAEAQASVFTAADDDGSTEAPAAPPATPTGWTCPDHPDVEPTVTTSGKGRVYSFCTVADCDSFQK